MPNYTGIDYALNYGGNDPLYDMLRRRLRDRVSGYMKGQQRYALGRLDARGIGQSSAVAGTLGEIAGQGLQAIGQGEGDIARQQARERFALLQDAIRREADKPGFWDVLPGVATGLGALIAGPAGAAAGGAVGGIAGLLRKKQAAGPYGDYTPESDYSYG